MSTTATRPVEAGPTLPRPVKATLAEAGVDVADLEPEQLERAQHAPRGLRGPALVEYVRTGRGTAEQIQHAKGATPTPPAKPKPRSSKGNGTGKRGSKRGAKPDTGKPMGRASQAKKAEIDARRAKPKGGLSVPEAIASVLEGKRQGMTAKAITEEIQTRKLAANLKGKTPVATVGATLATNDRFERVDRGLYKLARKR